MVVTDSEDQRMLFHSFDNNGNGHLTLTEVCTGLGSLLGGQAISAFLPAIARGFHAAKNTRPAGRGFHHAKNGIHAGDVVEWLEFPLLLVYLKRYFEVSTGGLRVYGCLYGWADGWGCRHAVATIHMLPRSY